MGVPQIGTRTSGSYGVQKQDDPNAGAYNEQTEQNSTEHNRVVDALIAAETAIGTTSNPAAASLEGRAQNHETRVTSLETTSAGHETSLADHHTRLALLEAAVSDALDRIADIEAGEGGDGGESPSYYPAGVLDCAFDFRNIGSLGGDLSSIPCEFSGLTLDLASGSAATAGTVGANSCLVFTGAGEYAVSAGAASALDDGSGNLADFAVFAVYGPGDAGGSNTGNSLSIKATTQPNHWNLNDPSGTTTALRQTHRWSGGTSNTNLLLSPDDAAPYSMWCRYEAGVRQTWARGDTETPTVVTDTFTPEAPDPAGVCVGGEQGGSNRWDGTLLFVGYRFGDALSDAEMRGLADWANQEFGSPTYSASASAVMDLGSGQMVDAGDQTAGAWGPLAQASATSRPIIFPDDNRELNLKPTIGIGDDDYLESTSLHPSVASALEGAHTLRMIGMLSPRYTLIETAPDMTLLEASDGTTDNSIRINAIGNSATLSHAFQVVRTRGGASSTHTATSEHMMWSRFAIDVLSDGTTCRIRVNGSTVYDEAASQDMAGAGLDRLRVGRDFAGSYPMTGFFGKLELFSGILDANDLSARDAMFDSVFPSLQDPARLTRDPVFLGAPCQSNGTHTRDWGIEDFHNFAVVGSDIDYWMKGHASGRYALVSNWIQTRPPGIVWGYHVHGEADAQTQVKADGYLAKYLQLIDELRADCPAHDIRIVCQLLNLASGSPYPYGPTVRAAQVTVSESRDHIYLMDMDDFPLGSSGLDSTHTHSPGNVIRQQRMDAARMAVAP